MGRQRIDLTGQRFGLLRVISYSHSDKHGCYWLCVCDCGNKAVFAGHNLRRGGTGSCGCRRYKRGSYPGVTPRSRGFKAAYHAWYTAVRRTTKPNDPAWKNYGARGITVCERWLDFPNFLADMGEPPPGLSLDRIGNDGDYEPGNCRWATRRQQTINRRSSKLTAGLVREMLRLHALGTPVGQIAHQVGYMENGTGIVLTTAEILLGSVTVPPEQYLRRLENIERMAEHEDDPDLYHS